MLQFAQMGFPEMYERALVPSLFRPWAEHIVRHLEIGPGDRVLDLACGTGIVGRLAKDRTGTSGRVIGIDVNPAMIAMARQVAPDIEWLEGEATQLPTTNSGPFDVVICQQGLQFVPDRAAAAAEMRRVLRPGGRLGVSVWRSDEEMPVLRELRRIAEERVGPISDRRHSFGDADALEELLVDAGFHSVEVQPVFLDMRFEDGAAFIQLNAMAMVGMSAMGQELDDQARARAAAGIAADSRVVLEAHSDASAFAYEIGANVAIARC
jgi:ubiquinone/menaquinone biosynthesis C-methylase UbiE